jgi:hypothetical protein
MTWCASTSKEEGAAALRTPAATKTNIFDESFDALRLKPGTGKSGFKLLINLTSVE